MHIMAVRLEIQEPHILPRKQSRPRIRSETTHIMINLADALTLVNPANTTFLPIVVSIANAPIFGFFLG